MMELGEPYRTLVFLVAVTWFHISEALGLKWSNLDYERQMIHLRRVWVGNWPHFAGEVFWWILLSDGRPVGTRTPDLYRL